VSLRVVGALVWFVVLVLLVVGGIVPSTSHLRPFHDELVKGVRVPFFLLPLLFSPVRCGLGHFACLVLIALLILLL
jgi:hypothetical protein